MTAPHIPKPVVLVASGYVAKCFGVSGFSLKAMWERGDIPKPIKIGAHTRFYLHEIQECLDKANAARHAQTPAAASQAAPPHATTTAPAPAQQQAPAQASGAPAWLANTPQVNK